MPKAPVPANNSTTVASSTTPRLPSELKTASRTLSVVGRVESVRGDSILRPRNDPATTRTCTRLGPCLVLALPSPVLTVEVRRIYLLHRQRTISGIPAMSLLIAVEIALTGGISNSPSKMSKTSHPTDTCNCYDLKRNSSSSCENKRSSSSRSKG
jgi:hypothetical protein